MNCRVSNTPLGILKKYSELRALDRCLTAASGIRIVCDVPSGPGRLFAYWRNRDFRVHGVDVSEPMVRAASKMHKDLRLQGSVRQGDAFNLESHLPEEPDIVVSIRFMYYFNHERRIELLKSLAKASRRFVLVQYKTTETLKGQTSQIRKKIKQRADHLKIHHCSHDEIIEELREAGLIPLHIDPEGEFSDRVYVLAEKPQADPMLSHIGKMPTIRLVKPWRHKLLVALILFFGLLYTLNFADRSFWDHSEAFYSLGAKSILQGDWLVPMINHDHPANMPPFMFWWVAAISVAFGGVAEWTGRLANVLASLGVLVALYGFARKRVGPWSALLAFVVLGTSYQFWENSTVISTDMVMLFFLTISWGAMYGLLTEEFCRKRWLMLWGGLALTILTRGPVGLVLTALISLLFCLWRFGRQGVRSGLMRLRPFSGMAFSLAPFLLWMGGVYLIHGFEPLQSMLLKGDIQRFVEVFDQHRPWYYFLAELPVNFLPWTVFFPFVAWYLMKNRHGMKGAGRNAEFMQKDSLTSHKGLYMYALTIIAAVFVFFSLSTTMRENNILLLMPWCALLTGDWLWRALCTLSPIKIKGEHTERQFGAVILGLKSARFLMYSVIILIFSMAVYAGIVTEWLDARKSPKSFALAVSQNVDHDDLLVIVDDEDPRVWFYLQDKFNVEDDDKKGMDRIRNILDSNREVDLLVGEDDLTKFLGNFKTPLYVQNVLSYRNDVFYHLTNESQTGLAPLMGFDIDEVSGIVYHPQRKTLFVVGDKGDIAETRLDGSVLNQARIDGDLEAITVCPDDMGLLVVDEKTGNIFKVSPETLEVTKTYRFIVADGVEVKPVSGGNGIEGLCMVPSEDGGRFFAVNQNDPPLLMEISFSEERSESAATVTRTHAIGTTNLAELIWDPTHKRLLALDDTSNLLLEIGTTGIITRRWSLPGVEQEAMTVMPNGSLLVCEESRFFRMFSMDNLTLSQ